MELIGSFAPPTEKGYLPIYLLVVAVTAMGNAIQGFATLHYTRRIYNGRFVSNPNLPPHTENFNPEDSVDIMIPSSRVSGKDERTAKDQVTPLAGRLFGVYTFCAGIIRLYACYQLENPLLYKLAIWTHVIAAVHFTSETFVYKTIRFSGPQIFPFLAAYGGLLWMGLQYNHYVVA